MTMVTFSGYEGMVMEVVVTKQVGMRAVVVDPVDNKPIVTGHEYGYGKNLQVSYQPVSTTRQITTFPADIKRSSSRRKFGRLHQDF